MNNFYSVAQFKFIISILITAGSLFFCNKSICQKNNIIQAVEVKTLEFGFDGKPYKVYYTNRLVMYECQNRFDTIIARKKMDTTNYNEPDVDSLVWGAWHPCYFVFHSDSSWGYSYDAFQPERNNVRLNVDTVLSFIKGSNGLSSLLHTIKPDSSIWSIDSSELKEVFISHKNCPDTPATRLSLYYSKKMNHIKESFAPEVDSGKGMKLYKIDVHCDQFYSLKDNRHWPSFQFGGEMHEFIVSNPTELNAYFTKYLNDCKKPPLLSNSANGLKKVLEKPKYNSTRIRGSY